MEYTVYQLLWLFLIYSFLGWLGETALAALRKRRLLNRGFLSTPFSPVYGLGGVLFSVFLPELRSAPLFLFLGGVILGTGLELLTGVVLEKLTGEKWWDYSDRKYHFNSYICPHYALIWGLCALGCLFVGNRFFLFLVGLIPRGAGRVILLVVCAVQILDVLASFAALLQFQTSQREPSELSRLLRALTLRLDNAVTRYVQRRVFRAYPTLEGRPRPRRERATVFAQGCGFYKLVWLFFLAALIGDLVETLFCRATAGVWMSRSSLVWGPFSIVWGFGAVLLTVLLYRYRDRRDGYLFLMGTLAGGAYEYMCSVASEIAFGSVFWDYSHLPFNLGGRINLLYCFFWGIATVVWIKYCYPLLSRWIERLPLRLGRVLTWLIVLFMVVNMALSALALGRFAQRQGDPAPAQDALGQFLDERFPDGRMERIYPNIQFVD